MILSFEYVHWHTHTIFYLHDIIPTLMINCTCNIIYKQLLSETVLYMLNMLLKKYCILCIQ